MHPLLRWIALAVILALTARAVHAVVPAIRGHISMGVAATLLLGVLYLARSVGIDRQE